MGSKKKKAAVAASKAAVAPKAEVQQPAPVPAATVKVVKAIKPVKEGALPALPKLPSAARTRKPKPMQPCACGCGTDTRSTWAPGHDARAKGWALRIERDICKLSDVPANEQAGAKLMLAKRKEAGDDKADSKGIRLAKGKGTAAVEQATAVNE